MLATRFPGVSGRFAAGTFEKVELVVAVFLYLEGERHKAGTVDQNDRGGLTTAAQALSA